MLATSTSDIDVSIVDGIEATDVAGIEVALLRARFALDRFEIPACRERHRGERQGRQQARRHQAAYRIHPA
jgi:hypothetical protein